MQSLNRKSFFARQPCLTFCSCLVALIPLANFRMERVRVFPNAGLDGLGPVDLVSEAVEAIDAVAIAAELTVREAFAIAATSRRAHI